MVDDLLKDLTVTFSSVCKEMFEKLKFTPPHRNCALRSAQLRAEHTLTSSTVDDMAARIDAMEARALAAVAAEEAEEAAAKNAEAK